MLLRSLLFFYLIVSTQLLAQDNAEISLPEPSGSNAVGTIVWHWIDTTRPEALTATDGDYREITVQAWYPAALNSPAAAAPYAPYYQDWSNVTSWSKSAPALRPSTEALPVIVLAPGRGMPSHFYTFVAEELASHGYFVMAVNSPHSGRVAYPDGRLVLPSERYAIPFETLVGPYEEVDKFYAEAAESGAADIAFALRRIEQINQNDPESRFTRRLDTSRFGAFGHSLGGRIVGAAVAADDRFVAYASMEGVPPRAARKNGMDAAVLMMLSSELPDMAQPNIRDVIPNRRNDVYIATLEGYGHNSVSDLPLIDPESSAYEIDVTEAMSTVRELLLLFFNEYHMQHDGRRFMNSTLSRVMLEAFEKPSA